MQDAGAKLTSKQEKAITALLGQLSSEAATAAIGVNAATIYRWLHEPDLADAYRLARWECCKQLSSGSIRRAVTRLRR